jgi:hypothetical protein
VHDRELQPHAAQIRALGHLWLAFYARRDHSVEGTNVVAREAQAALEILQQACSTADPEIVVVKRSPAKGKPGTKSRAVAQRPRAAKKLGPAKSISVSPFCLLLGKPLIGPTQ